MMNKKMVEALNTQINEELASSYLYLSMSAWFRTQTLDGFGRWLKAQADEELGHATKLFDYLIERGERVELASLPAPAREWKSPLNAFETVYKHECHITGCVGNLVDLAQKLKDHATNAFLQWYVTEQVEEEAAADDVVRKLRLVKDNAGGLFMLDRALADRGR